jgi:dienelactone hydrolase
MRTALLLLLTVLLTTFLSGQNSDYLNPREQYFQQKSKFNVTLSPDFKTIFYTKSKDGEDSTLYFAQRTSPSGEYKKRFTGKLIAWTPTFDDGLLAAVREGNNLSLYYSNTWSNSLRKVAVPTLKHIEFLNQNKQLPNKVLVYLETVSQDKSAYYLMDLYNDNLKYIGAKQEKLSRLFNHNFEPVAVRPSALPAEREIFTSSIRGYEEFFSQDTTSGTSDASAKAPTSVKLLNISEEALYFLLPDENGNQTLMSAFLAAGYWKSIASGLPSELQADDVSFEHRGRPIALNLSEGDKKRLLLADSLKEDFEFLDKQILSDFVIEKAWNNNKDWYIRTTGWGPVSYYYYSRDKEKQLFFLFSDYKYLEDKTLAAVKNVSVKTARGEELPIHIFARKDLLNSNGNPKLPMPMVIYLYGDPWVAGSTTLDWGITRHLELLANRGYVVAAVNLNKQVFARNATGQSIWNEQVWNDIVEIANWAVKSGTGLRKRIALMGNAYGAYVANMALLKNPDIFTASVAINCISNPLVFSQALVAKDSIYQSLVGDIRTEKGTNFLKGVSPVFQAASYKLPILMVSGGHADFIPQTQSAHLAKALADAKKEVIYFNYPNEGEDFKDTDSWVSFWAIAESFLNKHLGGNKDSRHADIELGDFQVIYGDEFIARIQ